MSDIIYEPTSDFLKLVANKSIQLGYEDSDANLQRLIELTTDSDVSNRDWATFLLSFHDLGTTLVDTPLVRKTLHLRLLDDDETVQEEALIGLALRKDLTALPQLKDWLQTRPLTFCYWKRPSGSQINPYAIYSCQCRPKQMRNPCAASGKGLGRTANAPRPPLRAKNSPQRSVEACANVKGSFVNADEWLCPSRGRTDAPHQGEG